MRTSENIGEIAKALAAAQAAMGNAELDSENPHFKSKYASLASIRDATVPILAKNGIAVTQTPSATESGNLILTTRFSHSSGEWIEGSYPVAFDKPQAMGSALTYAKRYSLASMCAISAEEDDDGNAAQKTAPAKLKTNGKPKGPSTDELRELVQAGEDRGVSPEEMTEYVQTRFKVDSVREITPDQLKELNAWIRLDPTKTEESEEKAHA